MTHVHMCMRDGSYIPTSLCVCYYFYFLFAQLSATYYPIVLATRIARGPILYSYPRLGDYPPAKNIVTGVRRCYPRTYIL